MGTHPIFESDFDCLTDNMNFESWAFDKMEFDFPLDPFGTLEVEGGFKGENLFGKCEESSISELMDESEREEHERIKAKYQNNLEFSKDVIINEHQQQKDIEENGLSPLAMGATPTNMSATSTSTPMC